MYEIIMDNQKQFTDFTQTYIFTQLINKTSVQQLESLYPQLDFSFTYACHRIFLIQSILDSPDSALKNLYLSPEKFQHILPSNCYLIHINNTRSMIAFSGKKHLQSWYENLAEKIRCQIQKVYQLNCIIAISDTFSSPDEVADIYQNTEKQLTDHFFFSNYVSSTTEDLSDFSSDITSDNIEDILQKLQTDIELKDTYRLKKHILFFIDYCKNNKEISYIYFRYLCTNVLKLLLDPLPEQPKEMFDKYITLIYQAHHFSEIENLLLSLTNELEVAFQKENRQLSSHYALQQVKQYIHTHYGEDLSLNILAQKVYLTPRYLSALFIEDTHYGINRYIKNVRMEKAKELLLNTNLKVNDICKKVGYSDLSYFCKSFSEEFGVTPNAFRQNAHTSS